MPKLAEKEECTGCSACLNACLHKAISMVADGEGFLNPIIDYNRCVECKLCERSCPVVSPITLPRFDEPSIYALWSNPDRTLSSSGGAFSAFARIILEKGGVVFGAAFDEMLHLHHIMIDNIADLNKLRGSKYVQSSIGETFKSVKNELREDKYVLFCGTPCQIAGLRDYLHRDNNKLLLLDLACHGVPSDSVWQGYLSKISTRFAGKTMTGYEFRRRNGWGFAPSVSLDGKFRHLYGVDSLYMEAFNKCVIFRKCCYDCKYANPYRVGDCSIADFWGLGRYGIPFKHDVLKGVSLVIVNTEKGMKFFKELKDVFYEKRTLKEALIENPNLRQPSKYSKDREFVIADFLNPDISLGSIDKKFNIVDHSLKSELRNLAAKLKLFDQFKRVYNFIKSR